MQENRVVTNAETQLVTNFLCTNCLKRIVKYEPNPRFVPRVVDERKPRWVKTKAPMLDEETPEQLSEEPPPTITPQLTSDTDLSNNVAP